MNSNLVDIVHPISIKGAELELHPEKVIYWADEKALLLSDLHLGKSGHFRRSGIPLPDNLIHSNLSRLEKMLHQYKPKVVYFLGDLFHSAYNPDWEEFGHFIKANPQVKFELVVGNHDILSTHQYQKFGITLHESTLIKPPFIFSHEPLEDYDGDYINMYGHIHPGVRLKGFAKQSLRLPCFYFSGTEFILPAFGEFTGTYVIQPTKKAKVYVIASGEVIPVHH